jgi:hypothetical protein
MKIKRNRTGYPNDFTLKEKEEVVAKCDHLAELLTSAERDIQSARTRLASTFLKEFKRAKNIQRRNYHKKDTSRCSKKKVFFQPN